MLRRYRQFTQTYPHLREALTPELSNHLEFPAKNPLLLGIGATQRARSRHLRLRPNPFDDHLDTRGRNRHTDKRHYQRYLGT